MMYVWIRRAVGLETSPVNYQEVPLEFKFSVDDGGVFPWMSAVPALERVIAVTCSEAELGVAVSLLNRSCYLPRMTYVGDDARTIVANFEEGCKKWLKDREENVL